MTPQLIYIGLFLVNLVMAGYQHGKPKTGTHSMGSSIISSIIGALLIYWGGFFDCFFLK